MILKPLQRIQVLESTKKFKPGSLGYFVAQDSVNSYNGWDICIVFTRFGKKGKNRIEPAYMRTYMVDYNTMKDSDREIIDITKLHEGIEPIQHLDRRGRILGALDEIKIEPFPIESKNLLDLPDNEFTAYIIALSMFIHKMAYNKRAYHLTAMPGIRQRDFVASDFNLGIAEPGSIGYYILNGIHYDEWTKKKQMPNRKSFRNLYAAQILTQSRKRALLNRLHMGLAMAKEPIKIYKANTENAFTDNSVRINHVLKYYRRHKKELKQIEESKGKQNSWITKAFDKGLGLKHKGPAPKVKARVEEAEVEEVEVAVDSPDPLSRTRWRA